MNNRKVPPPNIHMYIGICMWFSSWVIIAFNGQFGGAVCEAVFYTSYIAIFYGLWKTLNRE